MTNEEKKQGIPHARFETLTEDCELLPTYEMVKDVFTIGRHPTNDIFINSPSVSRFHCNISYSTGKFILTDLKSSNGTLLNNKKIGKEEMSSEDVIRVGTISFKFEYETDQTSGKAKLDQTTTVSFVTRQSPSSCVLTTKKGVAYTQMPTLDLSDTDVDSLRKDHSRLLFLYQLSDAMLSIRDLDDLVENVMAMIFECLPADRGCILLKGPNDGEFESRCARVRDRSVSGGSIAISRTIIDTCVNEKIAIISRDAVDDSRFDASESIVLHEIRSAMCVPLISHGKILGVIYIDTRESVKAFDDEDLTFLTFIANDIAIAIQNITLTQDKIRDERLTAIGQTIAGLAHTIKNILLLSKGGIELMDKSIDKEESVFLKENWGLVKRSMVKISHLVSDMLLFTKKRKISLISCNVNRLITELIESYKDEFSKGSIDMKFEPDQDVASVLIDEEGLYRAILDIVVNACEAMGSKGGHITIRTEECEGRAVQIRITDDGQGIEADTINRVFEPFFSTKGSKGTGLGLAITQKIIEDMGGAISVESEIGVGTTFCISLRVEATRFE